MISTNNENLIPLSTEIHRKGKSKIILIVLMLLSFLMMAWLSTAKYHGYNLQSFDLGNMSQSIWSVSQGKPLIFTSEGIEWSRLSLHVELFYFLLAPLYALRPSPDTLLILQSAFYVLGAWPLFRFAYRRLINEWAAIGLVATYLLYPVGQTAVLFHFHGDTLALPFLLFAIDAMDRQAWRNYGIWLIFALSCKFYVAIPVAAMGGVLWLTGKRKVGLGTILLAGIWGGVAFLIIRPIFASPEAAKTGASISYYFYYYFSQFFNNNQTFLTRLSNGLVVFAPVLLLAIRAPLWLIPATSIIVPVMISSGPGPSFDYRYHHYALAVPFLMAAAVYGLVHLRLKAESSKPPQTWTTYVWITFALTLILNMLLVSTPLSPLFYLAKQGTGLGLSETGYGKTDRDTFKDEWLAGQIPPDVSITANDQLGNHLANRTEIYRTHMSFKELNEIFPDIEFAVVDSLNDYTLGTPENITEGGVAADYQTITQLMNNPDFHLLNSQDGLLLFGKEGNPLAQTIEIHTTPKALTSLTQFGDAIALINAQVKPIENNRYRFSYTWQALPGLIGRPPLIAVSQLENVPNARIVHLPTLALAPTTKWEPNQLITESFEITLPNHVPPGEYPLTVSWYDTNNLFASQTDVRSQLGDNYQVGLLFVPEQ